MNAPMKHPYEERFHGVQYVPYVVGKHMSPRWGMCVVCAVPWTLAASFSRSSNARTFVVLYIAAPPEMTLHEGLKYSVFAMKLV